LSDDGADLNIPAEAALRAVLGGEQPESLSDEAFEQQIRTAPLDPADYGAAATYAARLCLEFLEAHPEHHATPIEAVGEWRDGEYVMVRPGLYDVMKAAGVPLSDLQLSGFQWGWASNAARHLLGLDHQPNPAIVTLRDS
jgi:hypothetical protein